MVSVTAKLCATSIVALASWWWPFESVYVWTRQDGDVFQLRFNMTVDHRITVLENYTPSPRSTAVAPQRGLEVREYYRPCAFFDTRNFVCHSAANEDYIEMRDGLLIHHYWGETRTYRAETRLAW
jgi:hypothetical protein